MSVRPEAWARPYEATTVELLEMVEKLKSQNKRLRKKAALSNARAEELEQKRFHRTYRLRRVVHYLALFGESRAEGWLKRAEEEAAKALDEKPVW